MTTSQDAFLASMFGGLNSGAGTSANTFADLSNFQNTIANNNLYKMAVAPVLGARFNTSTWSPTQTIGASAAQAFLGGILSGMGRNYEADQTAKIASVLPQLYKDPTSINVPHGVDPQAFGELKLSAIKQNASRDASMSQARQQLMSDLFSKKLQSEVDVDAAGKRAKAEVIGKNEAYDQLSGGGGDDKKLPTNPDDPKYKALQDSMKIEQAYTDKLLTGTQAAQALNLNKAALNIMDAIKQNNPLAASTAIFEFAKLQDPTGTVREGDEMRVADPGGLLGHLAQIHNQLLGEGKMTDTAKQSMRELVPVMLKNQFSQYNQLKDGYMEAAKQYGADPSRVKFVQPADLSSYLGEPKTDLAALALQFPHTAEGLAAFRAAASKAGQ